MIKFYLKCDKGIKKLTISFLKIAFQLDITSFIEYGVFVYFKEISDVFFIGLVLMFLRLFFF